METPVSQTENENEDNKKDHRKTLTSVFDWIKLFALYFSIGILVLTVFFRHSPVVGTSMHPTLKEKDLVIVSQIFSDIKTGDIIVCQSKVYGLQTPLVKRVIATGGQTVTIDYEKWSVTVDGVTLTEDYINRSDGDMRDSNYLPSTFTVPSGMLFVMGDNRNGSTDSRSASVGFIDERYVVGKVKLRLLPLSEIELF